MTTGVIPDFRSPIVLYHVSHGLSIPSILKGIVPSFSIVTVDVFGGDEMGSVEEGGGALYMLG